jgi:hypothetical protein
MINPLLFAVAVCAAVFGIAECFVIEATGLDICENLIALNPKRRAANNTLANANLLQINAAEEAELLSGGIDRELQGIPNEMSATLKTIMTPENDKPRVQAVSEELALCMVDAVFGTIFEELGLELSPCCITCPGAVTAPSVFIVVLLFVVSRF